MMTDLQKVLLELNIQSTIIESQFLLACQCPYSIWFRFINSSPATTTTAEKRKSAVFFQQDNDKSMSVLLKFNVMVYEARWAGGKIGFKVRENNDQHENAAISFYIKQVLKNISNTLLYEIDHLYSSSNTTSTANEQF
jgi:hypothetical protein